MGKSRAVRIRAAACRKILVCALGQIPLVTQDLIRDFGPQRTTLSYSGPQLSPGCPLLGVVEKHGCRLANRCVFWILVRGGCRFFLI